MSHRVTNSQRTGGVCHHCRNALIHHPSCIVSLRLDREQRDDAAPAARAPAHKFVSIGPAVMQGAQRVAVACSKTMAKRIAHALNVYKPNREGV